MPFKGLYGSGVEKLDDLTDVDVTTDAPIDADSLEYDSSAGLWVPASSLITIEHIAADKDLGLSSGSNQSVDLSAIGEDDAWVILLINASGNGNWTMHTPPSGYTELYLETASQSLVAAYARLYDGAVSNPTIRVNGPWDYEIAWGAWRNVGSWGEWEENAGETPPSVTTGSDVSTREKWVIAGGLGDWSGANTQWDVLVPTGYTMRESYEENNTLGVIADKPGDGTDTETPGDLFSGDPSPDPIRTVTVPLRIS